MEAAKHAQAQRRACVETPQEKLLLDFSWIQEINCFHSGAWEWKNTSLLVAA